MASKKVCKNGGLQSYFARNILSFGEDESGKYLLRFCQTHILSLFVNCVRTNIEFRTSPRHRYSRKFLQAADEQTIRGDVVPNLSDRCVHVIGGARNYFTAENLPPMFQNSNNL